MATDLNNLAGLLRRTGRPEEAEPLFRRAVDILERVLPGHPNTATVLNNLARLLRKLNREEEARPLEARARAILAGAAKPL